MFGSLFSDRYNKKREIFYAQYEATRARFPNLPLYKRPKEPLISKSIKRSRKKRRFADYDYDDWIAGNFVSIVVRRAVEQWNCRQLMEPAPTNAIDFCSWRSWPRQEEDGNEDEGGGGEEEEQAPRRSLRLTDKPNLRPSHISILGQQDTKVAIRWQQRLPTLEAGIKNEGTAAAGQELELELDSTFIDGCCNNSRPQCNMCGSHFENLQLHSLDDCRRTLIGPLIN